MDENPTPKTEADALRLLIYGIKSILSQARSANSRLNSVTSLIAACEQNWPALLKPPELTQPSAVEPVSNN